MFKLAQLRDSDGDECAATPEMPATERALSEVDAQMRRATCAGGEVMCSGEKMRLFPATLIFKEARRKGLAINID